MTQTASLSHLSPGEIGEYFQDSMKTCRHERFRAMLATYFKMFDPCEFKTEITRRPRLGFKLPHGGITFTVRPRWSSRYLDGIKTGKFDHERITVEAITQEHGRMLAFSLAPDTAWWSSWSHLHGPDALENFVEMANFFVLMPETVFAASSDHCCVCGRGLTDENSRCRGIGPECIQYVTDWMMIERNK